MAVFIDPRSGERYENVPDEDSERARRQYGLVPEAEFAHQKEVEGADRGFLSAAGKGFQRGLGAVQDFASSTGIQPPTPGGESFGPGGAPMATPETPAPAPPAAPETFPGAYDEQARLEREGRPFASGLGTGLATAVPAAIAGAAGAALGGPALFGAGVAGVVAEAGVEAVTQEYDDAWFEERPMQVQNVVANTFMFAPLDFAFRGALKGIGSVFSGKPAGKAPGAIGSRNVVSEAQGAARELVDPVGGGSVGAARASDLEDEFHGAIAQMSDRDAAVLARDAEPHFHLIAQDASESFTRLNNGLSDNVGNKLKYEDFATYAEEFDGPTLERQSNWLSSVSEQSESAVQQLSGRTADTGYALDFGNLGKKAAQTIDDFNRRILAEGDPGRRIVLVDDFKKSLDRLTMSVDASRSVDTVTRDELKSLIAPTREMLRKGLQNPKLFGGAADLQKALNEPWHGLLEHWSKVQKTLTEETGHVQFDTSGAGRITRESTVDRMLSLLGKDPRSNQEFSRHLAGSLENIQGLIDARQAHGIARRDGLDEMASDIRNLMEDWNLAQTIGVAKNRVDALKKDPRKWGTLALNLGERLPMVGQPIQLARTLGNAFSDLHIEKGTPLARVWDSAYKRYALNPVFQDPSIIRNYPDWIAESLTSRGGRFQPPPGGMTGTPAVHGAPPANDGGSWRGVAKEHGARVLGAGGLLGAATLEDSPEGSAAAGVAGLALLLGKRGLRLTRNKITPREARELLSPRAVRAAEGAGKALGVGRQVQGILPGNEPLDALRRGLPAPDGIDDVFSKHAGSVAGNGILAERISGPGGKTPGGFFRGTDGKIRYVKADKDSAHTVIESGNDRMYRALGVRTVELGTGELPDGTKIAYSSQLSPEWRELSKVEDWSTLPPSVSDSYASSVPVDIILGNWDVSRNANNVMTDGTTTLMSDAGEAGANAWAAKWYGGNESHLGKEISRLGTSARGNVPQSLDEAVVDPLWGPIVGERPPHALLARYAHEEGRLRTVMQESFDRAVAAIAGAGGPEAFIAKHQPTLTKAEVTKAATEMQQRIAALKPVIGTLAGMLYVAFSSDEAEAAVPETPTAAHAYRDALREVDQAGTQQVRTMASEALRKKPPRGKSRDPLALFAGKGSIQDAVEATRERLDEIGADPTTLLQQIGSSAGELGRTHPNVYMAVAQRAAQVAAYLQSVIPQRTVTTLLDPKGAPVSFDRAWDFSARFVGATQPRAAMREVARGAAPPEMVEAVAQNWPELWDGFRVEMLGQVQRMHAAGRHIPSEKLRRLDRLLGLGGQLDPSATLEVSQHMLAAQDAEAQQRQQQAQGGGQAPAGGSSRAALRTPLASINQERAAG